jgi:1-acyl-sn-glycerol-3-phosphate acyltransferase
MSEISHVPPENLDYTWRRRLLRWLLRNLAFKTLFAVDVEGVENVPAEGGTILMFNHTAFADPVAVAGVVERDDMVPMSKLENFKDPIYSMFVRAWGAISVRRGMVDRKALRYAIRVLKKGGSLLMAPEGTRVPALIKARNGITYVAVKANAVLVPVAVEGTDQFLVNLKQLKRTVLKMRFGQPFRFRSEGLDESEHLPHQLLNRMTSEAMYQLASLLPPYRRGVYSDLSLMRTDLLAFEGP